MGVRSILLPWDSQPQEVIEAGAGIKFHTLISPVSPQPIENLVVGAGFRTIVGPPFTLNGSSLIAHSISPTGLMSVEQLVSGAHFFRVNPIDTGPRSGGMVFIPATTGASRGLWSLGSTPDTGTPRFIVQVDGSDLRFYGGGSYRITYSGIVIPGVPLHVAWSVSTITNSTSTTLTASVNGVVRTATFTNSGTSSTEYIGAGYNSSAIGYFGEVWGADYDLPAAQLLDLTTPSKFYGQLFEPRRIWVPVGAVGGGHTLVGAATTQAASSATGAISQTHALVGAGSAQVAGSGTGAVSQTHVLAGAAATQGAVSGTGAISHGSTHTLTGTTTTQGATSGAGAVTQTHTIAGAGSAQAATSGAGTITQTHVLVGVTTAQGAISGTGAVDTSFTHNLAGAATAQAATSGAGAIVQTHALVSPASVQDATSDYLELPADDIDGGFSTPKRQYVYVKQGQKFLLFADQEQADEFLMAQSLIPIRKKSRKAVPKVMVKPAHVFDPVELAPLLRKYMPSIDVQSMLRAQQFEEILQAKAKALIRQRDDDEAELLLMVA